MTGSSRPQGKGRRRVGKDVRAERRVQTVPMARRASLSEEGGDELGPCSGPAGSRGQ